MKHFPFYFSLALLGLAGMAANSTADPLDQWTLRSSGTSQTLRAVTYANNEFVAVGSGGTILTSPDGVAWTRRSSGTSQDILAITYGNGIFMAVGPGIILTSADGSAWRSPASTTLPLNAVVYGDNSFLAVKTDSRPASGITSRDGITWTSLNLGFRLGGVAFGNHRFLACGEDLYQPAGMWGTIHYSLVYSSPDAITWILTDIASISVKPPPADEAATGGLNGVVTPAVAPESPSNEWPGGSRWALRQSNTTSPDVAAVARGKGRAGRGSTTPRVRMLALISSGFPG